MKNINSSTILIFSHDNKIGDAVILTSIIFPIKRAFPEAKIIVMAGKDNGIIWKKNPLIYKTFILYSRSILTRIFFSFVIRFFHPDFGIVTSGEHQGKSFSIIRKLIGIKYLIWVGTEALEFKNLKHDRIFLGQWNSKHYIERCRKVIEYITGSRKRYLPNIYLPKESLAFADRYWKLKDNTQSIRIILNTSGSTIDHQWSVVKIKELCFEMLSRMNGVTLHIISKDEKQSKMLHDVFFLQKQINVIEFRSNILDIAALIKSANLLVSPNTFAIHFGSVFNIPTLGVYVSKKTTVRWGSLSSKHINLVCKYNINNANCRRLAINAKKLLS